MKIDMQIDHRKCKRIFKLIYQVKFFLEFDRIFSEKHSIFDGQNPRILRVSILTVQNPTPRNSSGVKNLWNMTYDFRRFFRFKSLTFSESFRIQGTPKRSQ